MGNIMQLFNCKFYWGAKHKTINLPRLVSTMNKTLHLKLLSIALCFAFSVSAQYDETTSLTNSQIDSLIRVFPNVEAEKMVEIGQLILQNIDDLPTRNKAKAHEAIGLGLYNQNRFHSAIIEFEKAVEVFATLNERVEMAIQLNRIGVSYNRLRQYAKAMEYFNRALKIREELGDISSIASTLNNIAICFRATKQEDAALNTYKRCLQLFNQTNDLRGQSSSLNNIGLVFFDKHQFDSALVYFNNAITLKMEIADTISLAGTLANVGRTFSSLGAHKEAANYLNQSIELFKQKNHHFGLSFAYSQLAQIYLNQNLPNKAYPLIKKSQAISGFEENSSQALSNIKLLSDYYWLIGDYKKSREYLAEYNEKTEKLFTDEISSQVAELSYMFENERREGEKMILEANLEVEKLKLQRIQYRQIALFSILFFLILLLILSLIILYRFRNKRNELNKVIAELNRLNLQLENIVENRTQDLLSTLKKAQQSDKQKSAFLAVMSHEIRTPLNSILGFSKLLADEDLPSETKKKYIDIITKRGRNLLKIINDIINISLIDSGQVEVRNVSFNLNQLMYDLFAVFNSDLNDTKKASVGLNISVSLNDSRSNIVSDPNKIEQIITNLLDNAMKFTPSGTIQFGYEVDGHFIKFFVKDTGLGIAPDSKQKVFSRFNKDIPILESDQTTSGLGLPLCKGLVNLLNGNIWFESEVDKGTEFYFTIPYIQSNTESKSYLTRTSISSLSLDFSGKVILIVEDDLISYQFIEALLGGTNTQLIHAKNGEDAIEICKIVPKIDLVIMDMRLPFLNGYEATYQIKALNPNLIIIAQTANVMGDDKAKCFEAGCTDYLSKPLDPDEFLRTVANYLRKPIVN